MPTIANLDAVIEQVKALDIREVIGDYVTLKKQGTRWMAPCPFHHEKTASFGIPDNRPFWHCFGCGAGGDGLDFMQRIEGVDFIGAVKLLAERHGIRIDSATPVPAAELRAQRERELAAKKAALPFVAWDVQMRRVLDDFLRALYFWAPVLDAAGLDVSEIEFWMDKTEDLLRIHVSAPTEAREAVYDHRTALNRGAVPQVPGNIMRLWLMYRERVEAESHRDVLAKYNLLFEERWFLDAVADLKAMKGKESPVMLDSLRIFHERALEARARG